MPVNQQEVVVVNSSNLKGKRALVFGAGGSIGAAIAREFAAQGAEVFLSGRTKSKVEALAKEIDPTGKRAHAAQVDANDEAAVAAYVDGVARDTGGVDVVFNAIGPRPQEYGGGINALDITVDQYMNPLMNVVRSQFITAMAAARHMKKQGSGVILFITGSPARPHTEGATAIGAAFASLENLARHLAIELSPAGIRPICLRSSAMPDTRTIQDVTRNIAAAMSVSEDQAAQFLASSTMLRVSPTTADTAKVAAFLASDSARTITGTQVMSEIR
ncbi:MAG TPA: SDR family oxidoreductase [Candidatus Dormibacteraeota bacterium]|nr:SDR family oxidoreductase [Candidatus Dormibacteraeota bacterium]